MLAARAHRVAASIAFVLLIAWLLFAAWQASPYSGQATQKQGSEKTDGKTKHDEPWLTKDAAGFFTFLLVVIGAFQVGLFYVQLRLIKKTLGPAVEAAEAAKTNAQAVINAERAYLWPGFASHLGRRYEGGGAAWNISVLNTGHTAGILTEIYYALVPEDDYNAGQFRYTPVTDRGEIIPPSRPGEEMPSGIIMEVLTGTRISCGYIVYTDVYKDRHEQAWKHRLHAAGVSEPLARCYSDPPDKNH